jgi:hypothetical protein
MVQNQIKNTISSAFLATKIAKKELSQKIYLLFWQKTLKNRNNHGF